jgi:hypothetical protein
VVVPRAAGGTVRVMAYEASRADATATSAGAADTVACARPNVVPWTTVTWAEANVACCALNASGTCAGDGSGWRLCDGADWERTCRGTAGTCDWSYGGGTNCTSSSRLTCNGAEFDCNSGLAGDQDLLPRIGQRTRSPKSHRVTTGCARRRVFKKVKTKDRYNHRFADARDTPPPEQKARKVRAIDTCSVNSGKLVDQLDRNVSVLCSEEEYGQTGENEIEHLDGTLCKILLTRKAAVEVEPEHTQRHENVFIKNVAHKPAHAYVVVAPVLENERGEVAKLCYRVIGRVDSLETLLTSNAHAHVGFLYHGHVVGAITNSQGLHTLDTTFNKAYHLPFLVRRDSAGHDGATLSTKR